MSSRLIFQRNLVKQNYGVVRDEASLMMECEMMDEDRVEKLEQPFLERLKRENVHENMNEKTPDALMTAARRKFEVDRLRKEKLKEVVREVARTHPISRSGMGDVNLDVVTTMSRVTSTALAYSLGADFDFNIKNIRCIGYS
ncbi:unnamed protein product [Allacma fusca]|uniref:Uncharacterized protein n=1 Tax=Allacma fusca TaxID=39272 RepID=A0A8J2JZG5_9HEXA|nr:unnamed protein product [Allacma fusca]